MNIRKLMTLLSYLSLIIVTYLIINKPEDFILDSIYIFSAILFFELLFFGSEYLIYIKPKGIYLLETRTYLDLDTILYIILVIAFLIALILQWGQINITPGLGLLFSTITTVRGFFTKQRNSLRVDSDRILFSDLFESDIWIGEIKSAIVNTNKNNIELTMQDNQLRLIKLKESFLKDEKNIIENLLKRLNNVA
nr:hypothetical protein [uncultured Carboxylicivirga sp.]